MKTQQWEAQREAIDTLFCCWSIMHATELWGYRDLNDYAILAYSWGLKTFRLGDEVRKILGTYDLGPSR